MESLRINRKHHDTVRSNVHGIAVAKGSEIGLFPNISDPAISVRRISKLGPA